MPTVPKLSSLRLGIFRWREVGILGADQKNRGLWERQRGGSKLRAKVYEHLRNSGGIKLYFKKFDAVPPNSPSTEADNSQSNFLISRYQPTLSNNISFRELVSCKDQVNIRSSTQVVRNEVKLSFMDGAFQHLEGLGAV